MDVDNPVVQLCIQGTQAEFAGRPEAAAALYGQAWEAARSDFEACIAAHYVARFQADPADGLYWNQLALVHALAADQAQVEAFYPSLYLNLGRSYAQVGDAVQSQHYYAKAAELGAEHQME